MANALYLKTVRSRIGMLGGELADDEAGNTDGREHGQDHDEVRAEPVILLALVEHHLQAANADRQQADAPVVDAALYPVAKIRRIEDENFGEDQRDDADGDVDVEDPAPAVVVGEPSAGDRAEHRRDHDAERPEGHRLPALFGGKGFQQNGLREWLQSSAAGALNHPTKDEERQGGCEPAEKRCHGEAGD